MHPILFRIGSFPIPSYGTMLALSFLTGIFLAMYLAKKRKFNPEVVADLSIFLIISAVVGARLYYVMTHFDEFRGNLLSIINPIQKDGSIGISGLVMYGGFIAAMITAAAFFKIKKLPVLAHLDIFTPSVGFGIAITRIGCFLNGCCYGAAAKAGSFFSVSYPNIHGFSPAASHQLREGAHGLFPSQFLESAGGIVIAITLLFVGRSKRYFPGLQFYLMIVMYAVLRFFVETTRVLDGTQFGRFSHNQVLCMILFTIFGGLTVRGLMANKSAMDAITAGAETAAPNQKRKGNKKR